MALPMLRLNVSALTSTDFGRGTFARDICPDLYRSGQSIACSGRLSLVHTPNILQTAFAAIWT